MNIPYSTQSITAAEIEAVTAVLQSGWLTQGPAVPRFESALAERHACAHAIAVTNATAALHLGCLALGVGPGQRVWTSPISFVASANCALYCGAEVDFVDVDEASGLMSMAALEAKLDAARRAGTLPNLLIPVAFAGQPADLAGMRELADRHGFRLMDDASHAVGAAYQGHPIGARHADLTVFSFHPVKIITTGEGGLLLTQDEALAQRLRDLRSHGITRDAERLERAHAPGWYYEQQSLGHNCRMTDLQAALGSSQLGRLDAMFARRKALAFRYDAAFAGDPDIVPLRRHADRESALHLYPVLLPAERRDAVFAALRAAGIGVNVHYHPIPLQPHYRRLGFQPGAFPAAERHASRTLSLPLYPDLGDAQQDEVIARLRDALARS